MNILSSFKAKVAAGAEFRFSNYGSGYGATDPWGGLWRMLSGSTFDYRREAGILWENSICMAGVKWVWRNFPRARLVVMRPTKELDANGAPEYEEVQGHPLTELWARPNPFYSRTTLMKGMLLSYMIDGNSHTFINRNRLGTPVELYYTPHFQISPRWQGTDDHPTFPGESTNYIDHWEYRVDGKFVEWKPNDVFHWRDGYDPQNPRRGLSALGSVLREIAGDNCASTLTAALLRNNNIPGLIVSPKAGSSMTDVEREKLTAVYGTKFKGDRAGEALFSTAPLDMQRLGFSMKEMDLGPFRDINEERIMAQWGIPLPVVGMGSGLAQTKVGATMKSMIELAWDQCLIPMQDEFGDELTFWAKAEFSAWMQDGEIVVFDRSKVSALQGDVNELHTRTRNDWQADLLTREEAKRKIGMKTDKTKDDVYYSQVATAKPVSEPDPEDDLSPDVEPAVPINNDEDDDAA